MMKKMAFSGSAELYDLLYEDKNYEKEVEFIEKQFGADKSKKILELGCGTGNYLKIFFEKNYNITGLDISKEMLEIAKKKCDCDLIQEDIKNFKIDKKFDVILIMFDVLSYINKNLDVENVLNNVRNHLNENGLLIFQVWNGLGVLYNKLEKSIKEAENEKIKIIRIGIPILKAEEHIVDMNYKYLIINKENNKIDEVHETHSIRFFFPQEIKYFLKNTGFDILTISDFMDKDKKVNETTWSLFAVAKKKK